MSITEHVGFVAKQSLLPVVDRVHLAASDADRELVLRLLFSALHKDTDTGAHCFRIGAFAGWLARHIPEGIPIANSLFWSAPLHDIGKIGVPDRILQKPTKLTPDEWAVMRQHAEVGAAILRGSHSPTLQMASIVAYEHHEKFDGSGYPRGLAGRDIFLGARIVAVVDVFDALTSSRCYRDALPDEEVLRHIKMLSGTHLDPDLTDALFDDLPSFLGLRDSLRKLPAISKHYADLASLANMAAALLEQSSK